MRCAEFIGAEIQRTRTVAILFTFGEARDYKRLKQHKRLGPKRKARHAAAKAKAAVGGLHPPTADIKAT